VSRREPHAAGAALPARRCAAIAVALLAGLGVAAPARGQTPAAPQARLVTDGPVHALAQLGDRTYLGGAFTRVGPRTGPAALLDAAGAVRDPRLPEVAGGEVLAVAADGAGGWFLGGDFNSVGGVARDRLARVRADGSLDPAWRPSVRGGPVRALALGTAGGRRTLYVGGSFSSLAAPDGSVRGRSGLAALDADSGAVLSWDPNPRPPSQGAGTAPSVHALATTAVPVEAGPASIEVPVVIAAGDFAQIGAQTPPPNVGRLAALWGAGSVAGTSGPTLSPARAAGASNEGDAVSTGGSSVWSPPQPSQSVVRAVALAPAAVSAGGTRDERVRLAVYAGGDNPTSPSSPSGATAYLRAYQLSLSTRGPNAGRADPAAAFAGWSPNPACRPSPGSTTCNAPVRALAADAATVYVGGDFERLGPGSGSAQATRPGLGAVTALADVTNPSAAGNTGALKRWDPRPAGRVHALAVAPGAVFAGGDFAGLGGGAREPGPVRLARIEPASPAGGGSEEDTAAGAGAAWDAGVAGGDVLALAAAAGRVLAAGSFASVGASRRAGLAAVEADGTLAPWDPSARCTPATPETACSAAVRALAASGGTVYAGGDFTAVGGAPRRHLAALDAATGTGREGWAANADAPVLALTVARERLYAGGAFAQVAGRPRERLAAVDAGSGALLPWDPGAAGAVYALDSTCETVYAGGAFTALGGAPRNRIGALDAVSGAATGWDPDASGTVFALHRAGATVYAGGTFGVIGGRLRRRAAGLDAASGAATAFDPSLDGPVRALASAGEEIVAAGLFFAAGEARRPRVAVLDGRTGVPSPLVLEADEPVTALASARDAVLLGGRFARVDGRFQRGFGAFLAPGARPRPPACGGEPPGAGSADAAPGAGGGAAPGPGPGARAPAPTASRAPAPRDRGRPRVSRLRAVPPRFRTAGARGGQRGTTLRFVLSAPARVTVLVERVAPGRLTRGRGCRAGRPRGGERACRRYVAVGAFQRRVPRAGPAALRVPARLRGRRLRPGRYRAAVTARDRAGRASFPRRVAFRVLGR